MMRIFIFISLLVLIPILFQEARGARLVPEKTPNGFDSVDNSKSSANFEVEDSNVGKGNVRILESGRIRKLLVTKTSTSSGSTTTLSENNDENRNAGPNSEEAGQSNNERFADDKVESLSVHSSKMTTQQVEQYDLQILDVTEMDYSPAQRKPPIHN